MLEMKKIMGDDQTFWPWEMILFSRGNPYWRADWYLERLDKLRQLVKQVPRLFWNVYGDVKKLTRLLKGECDSSKFSRQLRPLCVHIAKGLTTHLMLFGFIFN